MSDRIAIGVDMGGTKTLAVLYSESSGVIEREQIGTDRYASPEISLTAIAVVVRELTRRAGISLHDLEGIGIGVPGLVNLERIFIDSIILPTWFNVNVHEWLSNELKVPIVVDNDATMAAIGHWSYHHDIKTLLCLTLGTGVGAAAIIDGSPLRGPDGMAGQLGHVTLNIFGRQCSCGSKGCLNAYVSGTAIAERYMEALTRSEPLSAAKPLPVNGQWVSNAAQGGDSIARDVIEQTSLYLGAGLASLVNVFNPDIIAISGGVSELGETLLAPARVVVAERAFQSAARRVQIECGRFGTATGAIGAAISVWQHT
jgi:glucokinase